MRGNERDRGTGFRRRHGALLAALALLLAAAPAGLPAARSGSTLRLQLLDGKRLEGELLAVKGEVLVLMGWSGSEARVGLGEVAELRIERGNQVSKGLVGGMAAGFALGTLLAIPATFSHNNEYSVLPIMICGGLGGGFGAILGTIAGLIGSGNDTIRPLGRDAAWRAVALGRLRRLARFRDPEGGAAEPGPGHEAGAGTFMPRHGEFKRWRACVSLVQSPPAFTRGALDFAGGLRYGDPVAPRAIGTAKMSTDDGRRSWVGMRDIGVDYFLTRRWAIGVRLNPFFGSNSAFGRKTVSVFGQDTDASWHMHTGSRTYFLTSSYSLLAADGFLQRTALRLGAGMGWNRSSFDYSEYGYHSNPNDSLDPANFSYSVWMARHDSTALCALVEAEAAQYFNSRWSLALTAGFRYVPLRIRSEELTGRIERRAPRPGLDFALAIPGSTLNIGGFYLGVKLGFHF
jgi:hypothetical protein